MDSIEIWISIAIPVVLIVVGRVVGSAIERNHYREIIERESSFHAQPALSTKQTSWCPWTTSSVLSVAFG